MARITVEGPDAPILFREDVLSLLRVSESTLARMIVEGRFPTGIKTGPGGTPFWSAADVACWLHLAARMVPHEDDPAGKVPKKSADKES